MLTQRLPIQVLTMIAWLKLLKLLLAHPTRFERVTFAFGGQRLLELANLAGRGQSFSDSQQVHNK